MKIEDIAKVYQGITLSRIRNKGVETERYQVYSFLDEEENYIEVPIDNRSKAQIPVTKGMVLLNLTSHRASIIREDQEGKVVPSTFIVLIPNERVVAEYLEWYINESRDFKKNIELIKQGSIIQAIPIQLFKKMDINIASIKTQEKISDISRLIKKSKRLLEEREHLLKEVLKHTNQEDIEYDK